MATKWEIFAAMLDSTLPTGEKMVLTALINAADKETGVVDDANGRGMSQTRIARHASMSVSTVVTKLEVLESAGWLVRNRPSFAEARANHTKTRYRLLVGNDPSPEDLSKNRKGWKKKPKTREATPVTGVAPPRDGSSSDADQKPVTGVAPPRDGSRATPVTEVELHPSREGISVTVNRIKTVADSRESAAHDEPLFDLVPDTNATPTETTNQRVNRLAKTLTDRSSMHAYHSVRGIVAAAIADGYDDEAVITALNMHYEERRTVTKGSMLYALGKRTRKTSHMAYTDAGKNYDEDF